MENSSNNRIALFLHDQTNDYQKLSVDDCKQAAKRHSLHLTVFSAEKDAELQAKQIRDALALVSEERPDLILVSPVREVTLLPLVYTAARLGISFAFLARYLEMIHDLRQQFPRVPIFAVRADQQQIGRIQGRQLRLLLRPGDELVYIQGPLGTSSTKERFEGTEAELSDLDVRWAKFNSDWSQEGGHNAMKNWIVSFPRGHLPGFVVAAQNDDMALGARKALLGQLTPGYGALRLVGCDGSSRFGQRLVNEGQLTATIVIPPVAGRAVDEYVAVKQGRRPSVAEINVGVTSYPEVEVLEAMLVRASGVHP